MTWNVNVDRDGAASAMRLPRIRSIPGALLRRRHSNRLSLRLRFSLRLGLGNGAGEAGIRDNGRGISNGHCGSRQSDGCPRLSDGRARLSDSDPGPRDGQTPDRGGDGLILVGHHRHGLGFKVRNGAILCPGRVRRDGCGSVDIASWIRDAGGIPGRHGVSAAAGAGASAGTGISRPSTRGIGMGVRWPRI